MRRRNAFKTHLAAADTARDARQWPEARQHYEAALAEDPQPAAIWVQLGHARKESGDLGGAETAYRRALAIQADVADTHLQLGHLLKMAGRTPEAVAAYAEAARLRTDPWDAHKELADLGCTPGGLPIFSAEFGRPSIGRRASAAWWFSLPITLHGIGADEVLRLQKGPLRLGYALHDGSSSSPARHLGEAQLSWSGGTGLLARLILPADENRQPARLVQIGFRYGGAEDADAFLLPRVWLLIEIEDDSLGAHYRELTTG